jgi:hypothetical protein
MSGQDGEIMGTAGTYAALSNMLGALMYGESLASSRDRRVSLNKLCGVDSPQSLDVAGDKLSAPHNCRHNITHTAQASFDAPVTGRSYTAVLHNLHDTRLEPSHGGLSGRPVNGRPVQLIAGKRTGQIGRHLHSSLKRLIKFSRD